MPQSYTALYYHLIFSTKNRLPTLSDAVRPRLCDFIGGIVRHDGGVLLAAGGTDDHIHLLASISKQKSISESLRSIKAGSSGWIHRTFPEMANFQWQAGYGAFSVGHSALARVTSYIANQKEHHRSVSFQEEFLEFLRRYGVAFDERYIWD